MDRLQSVVNFSLRDTETCTAATEVVEISATSTKQIRRVLAVVIHKYPLEEEETENNAPNEKEEGCLFVMKYEPTSPTDLYPYLLFPINSELRASLKQRSGGDGSGDFELTLKIPSGGIVVASRDMQSLSAVLEEARRLKALDDPKSALVSPISPISPSGQRTHEDANEDDFEAHWEWLHFYISRRFSCILSFRQPKPPDIRLISAGFELSQSSAGMPVDEEQDTIIIRDDWVRRQLFSKRNEFSKETTLKLRIGTFNVNGKMPSQSLSAWLWGDNSEGTSQIGIADNAIPKEDVTTLSTPQTATFEQKVEATPQLNPSSPSTSSISESSSTPASAASSSVTVDVQDDETLRPSSPRSYVSTLPEVYSELPDLFVLGFQEVDLSTESLIYRTSSAKEEAWTAAIFEALGKVSDQYVKLVAQQLVGVLVIAVIRKDVRPIVKEISVSTAAVGFLGFVANKGAAALRLCLNSTPITFVCSHLAAFDEYVEKRNSDFAELARKLSFPITSKGTRSMQALSANIWETDMLFWLGDLNYRIDLPDDEIRTFLSQENRELQTLIRFDQLKTAALHKNAFIGFEEEDITFLPTYRYGEFPRDALGYDLKRKPAWTDRILYISPNERMVVQKCYKSHPSINMSDHSPVSADFEIIVHDNEERKYFKTLKSIFRSLGDFEDTEETPSVKILGELEIEMGNITYLRPISKTIQVQNTGKTACAFRFVPLEPGSPIAREWLDIKPLSGLLLPEEIVDIEITAQINDQVASLLNQGNTKLGENLVLHLINGTDYVISVWGEFEKTCFANNLAGLVRSPGPIRTIAAQTLLPKENSLNAPREFIFLIEWLMTNAANSPDLFLIPGKDELVYLIREHLDTQPLDSTSTINFPEGTLEQDIALAFGSTLIQFLSSLSEPVIPWLLHPQCALVQEREQIFELLDGISPFARNVFVTVTAFLHFIALSSEDRPKQLARVFGDVLLKDNPKAPPGMPALTPLRKRQFTLLAIS